MNKTELVEAMAEKAESSEENAKTIYAQVNQSGELSDDDLAMVAGGKRWWEFWK